MAFDPLVTNWFSLQGPAVRTAASPPSDEGFRGGRNKKGGTQTNQSVSIARAVLSNLKFRWYPLRMRSKQFYVLASFLAGIFTGVFAAAVYGTGPSTGRLDNAAGSSSERIGTYPAVAGALGESPVAMAAAVDGKPGEAPPAELPMSETRSGSQLDLQQLVAASARLQSELDGLRGRVRTLEAKLESETPPAQETRDGATRPKRPETPEERRSVFLKVGVAEALTDDLIWREAQQALDRLELRDVAAREGWLSGDRYREELQRISENDLDVRAEIGEDLYDRYLFAAGRDNRVEIASIIPGSAAEETGLEPGDRVETYAGVRVFNFGDLRSATTEGERGELVQVRIRRGNDVVDAWVPRGPLGVRLDRAWVDPDA